MESTFAALSVGKITASKLLTRHAVTWDRGTMRIASVTVAYNAADVLPRQLDALRRQTLKLDEIVVVNNASSDGTADLLVRDYPEVTVLHQHTNGGVGGGYAAGLHYAATEKKYDWIWLLDQDSVPTSESLERLIDGFDDLGEYASDTAILAPVCMHTESKRTHAASLWRCGLQELPATGAQRVLLVDSVISSGTLLRREAVEDVGLPLADFFMDFVDHEYCLRLRRRGYKIAVVTDSRLEHEIGNTVQVDVFGSKRSWTVHAPWREYYMARNEIFTVWKYFPDWRTKSNVARRLLRHALAILLLGRQKISCLEMMARGVADGRAGRLGIRYVE